MTRKNTEKTEAETRKRQKQKKYFRHGKTRKKGTSFRAGCVSDGINIRFGKGPFGKLRDRSSFGTVSELASGEPAEPVELADKLRNRGFVRSVSLPALRQQNPSN